MIRPWCVSPARICAVDAAAARWLGTPYVSSGAVQGVGASCHMLAAAVLAEAGCPLPPVPGRGGLRKSDYRRAMLDWFRAHPAHFAPIGLDEAGAPADLLVVNAGCGHIGLCVSGPGLRVLQVLCSQPAHVATIADARTRARIVAAWRPLEP